MFDVISVVAADADEVLDHDGAHQLVVVEGHLQEVVGRRFE